MNDRAKPHITPLSNAEEVIAAIDGDGFSVVLNEAEITFFYRNGTKSAAKATVQVIGRRERMFATIWLEPQALSAHDFPALSVNGRDALGDSYVLQAMTQSMSAGAKVLVLNASVRVLRGVRDEERTERPMVVMRLPAGLVYPFSSVTTKERKCGPILVHKSMNAEGYFGIDDDVVIDIDDNRTSNTMQVMFTDEAPHEKLIDAADGAASYVLGIAIEPVFSSARSRKKRTVILYARDGRPEPSQTPAPIDLRADPDGFSQLFAAFFRRALAETGELRSKAHALVYDVYQTYKSGYVPHQILLTCIAVESLLRMLAPTTTAQVFSSDEMLVIGNAIDGTDLAIAKKSRIKALLTQVNSPSVSYLFDQMIEARVLSVDHKRAWQRNRSVFAHGGTREDDPSGVLGDRAILLNAFHRLIAQEIGVDLAPA